MAGTLSVGLLLALFSALTTAAAHALLKSGDDKLSVQAWIRMTGCALALPVALYVGLPPKSLLPWLLAAAAIHAIYQLILSWSYSVSDFSVAYPIARGSVPIFTAVLGMVILGDSLDVFALAGIAIVSAGILCLASGRAISGGGLLAAGATGFLTTCYTLVDAKGVRIAPDALTFIAWFFVFDSFSMPALFLWRNRGKARTLLRENRTAGLSAGIMAPLSFVPALFALGMAPVGAVSALRETSVLIGLVFGGMMLKEKLDARRIGGAALVTLGALAVIVRSAFA